MNYNLATEMVESGLLSQDEGKILYPVVSGFKFTPGQVRDKYQCKSESDKNQYKMEVIGRGLIAYIYGGFSHHHFVYTISNQKNYCNCRGNVYYDKYGVESVETTMTRKGFFIRSVRDYSVCNIKFYDLEALNTYVTIMKQEPAFDAEKIFKKIGISPDKEVKIVFDQSEGVQNFIGNISNNPDYAEELHNLVGLDLEENLGKSQER